MSIKLELACRVGTELMPETFGTDLLIGFIRELAIVADEAMSVEQLAEFGPSVRGYIRKVVGLLPDESVVYYENNRAKLIPLLCTKLFDYLSDELVSRLVQYTISKESLVCAFGEIVRIESHSSRRVGSEQGRGRCIP